MQNSSQVGKDGVQKLHDHHEWAELLTILHAWGQYCKHLCKWNSSKMSTVDYTLSMVSEVFFISHMQNSSQVCEDEVQIYMTTMSEPQAYKPSPCGVKCRWEDKSIQNLTPKNCQNSNFDCHIWIQPEKSIQMSATNLVLVWWFLK